MKKYLSLLLLFLPLFLPAQNRYVGKVIDAKTKKALAYVNIGVVGKNVGTVSDRNGDFSLRLPPARSSRAGSSNVNTEELKMSMVGYESLSFSVSEFKKEIQDNNQFFMKPKVVDLDEVIVMPAFTKTKMLGNKARKTYFDDGFDQDVLGREGGIIVKLKPRLRPAQVLKFRTYINENTYPQIRFRLNFYSLKKGIPFKKIIQKNIIVTSEIQSGVLEVNLEDYQIKVAEDFAVTLEWIEDLGNRGNLNFSFKLLGPDCVFRYTSQSNWEIYEPAIMSPAMNVVIGY